MKFYALTLLLLSQVSYARLDDVLLCNGDRIINDNDKVGEIVEIFSTGKAKVKFDGYSSTYVAAVNTLFKLKPCVGRLCAGTRIINDNDKVGDIVEIFSNGKARIKFDGYSSTYVSEINNLGKKYACVGQACENDRIINSNDKSGTILEVFDTGKARIRYDGYSSSYVSKLSDLGFEMDCTIKESCRGRDHR